MIPTEDFLDRGLRPLPRRIWLCTLLLLPLAYVASQFDPRYGFLALEMFGPSFEPRVLPKVRRIPKPPFYAPGYDGQFQAQLATDPFLTDSRGLGTALDAPEYRARRILPSMLAFLLGLGRTEACLQAYALMNLAFFALLWMGLIRFVDPSTPRDLLCVTALLWTTGAMVSVQRSLVDLPAATLALWGLWCAPGWLGAAFGAMAGLSKESALLALPAFVRGARDRKGAVLRAAAVLLPPLLWFLYVRLRFPEGEPSSAHLGWPLAGWARALGRELADFQPLKAFEPLSILSLLAQSAYLILRPAKGSPYWRLGIAFAVVCVCFSAPRVEQAGHTRQLLLLTFAFNLLLLRERGKAFWGWFLAGNLGLAWGALFMLKVMTVGVPGYL